MLTSIKKFNTAILALAALTSIAPSALAQAPEANYPNKAIRLIVPVPPGGAADGMARLHHRAGQHRR
jgi:tripartite-type tricarboxylate transporter receptor subunit TctC